jgi:hypothetical protein
MIVIDDSRVFNNDCNHVYNKATADFDAALVTNKKSFIKLTPGGDMEAEIKSYMLSLFHRGLCIYLDEEQQTSRMCFSLTNNAHV